MVRRHTRRRVRDPGLRHPDHRARRGRDRGAPQPARHRTCGRRDPPDLRAALRAHARHHRRRRRPLRPAPRRAARPAPPGPRDLGVLVTDPRLYVVDKPAGLPVHASAKFYFNTLTRVLGERFPDEPELQICHRLDRETSGCLVVARDRAAAAAIKHAFATKDRVRKQYLAVVHGQPPWHDEHTIDLPLRVAGPGDPTKLTHVRMLAVPDGLPAITRVQVERRTADHALIRCTLVTGRQHQIRAHLAAAGFPIVGDKLYAHGDDAFLRYCNEGLVPELARRFVLPRHALHAARVSFPHPDGGEITAEAPLPADLAGVLG